MTNSDMPVKVIAGRNIKKPLSLNTHFVTQSHAHRQLPNYPEA